MVSLSIPCPEENLSLQVVKTSILNEETRRREKGVLRTELSRQSRGQMWHNILVEEEASKEVHKRETSIMSSPSLEENSHGFTIENLGTSKRIVNTLRRIQVC